MTGARPTFLVTGGAGFVGSHVVLALLEADAKIVVIDNLSTGHRAAVPDGVRLMVADVTDGSAIRAIVGAERFDAILHFASLSLVGESMAQPFRYVRENLLGALNLIEAAVAGGVPKFVLSSTANLFADAGMAPIPETATINPGSPYGESKAMIERALYWADRLHGLRTACLRYFNAAGADPAGRAGEDHRPETHLIPAAIDAALGRRESLNVFGTDYDTGDGTCIRDYVHVTDIAAAHLAVLDLLDQRSVTLNIGTGRGASVREVLAAVGDITGRAVPTVTAGRRAGDPACLIADGTRLAELTPWRPRFSDLETIVKTAFTWREAHPSGYQEVVLF